MDAIKCLRRYLRRGSEKHYLLLGFLSVVAFAVCVKMQNIFIVVCS